MTPIQARVELRRFVKTKTTQEPAFLSVCLKALDKQIAEKPEIKKETYGMDAPDYFFWKCPTCGETYYFDTNGDYSYCPDCGQKIDWDVAEDEDDN